MTEVSVILPNYNHAPFLQERIESILQQTYQSFELILLDDASTDNSADILQKYEQHPRVTQLIINKNNSGSTFRQWQKGIELAKGNYIWIAESDDNMEDSFLEKAMNVFTTDESIGIFQCGSRWIDETGTVLEESGNQVSPGKWDGREFLLNRMSTGNAVYNASAVVFKKSLVALPISKNITNLTYCGDWFFWVKILERSNLFYWNENLNGFRRHTNNVSGKAEKKGLYFLEGIQVYGYIKKKILKRQFLLHQPDKDWVKHFLQQQFSFSTRLKFAKNALEAGLLLPVYFLFRYGWLKLFNK